MVEELGGAPITCAHNHSLPSTGPGVSGWGNYEDGGRDRQAILSYSVTLITLMSAHVAAVAVVFGATGRKVCVCVV